MTNIHKLYLSGQFADWFYLRTGKLATDPLGKQARKSFLNGKLVKIKVYPKVGFEVLVRP